MPDPYVPNEEEETETTGSDPDDAALVAAAEAALNGNPLTEAKPEGDPERDEHGRFIKQPKAPPEKKPEPPSKPSSVIARELAKREAARAEETAYKTKMQEAEQTMAQARQMLQTIQQQQAELEQERQTIAAAKRDPVAFMKQVGWTAEQFIDNATRSKDPAYQQVVALQEEITKRDSVIGRLEQRLNGLEQKAKSYDDQATQAQAQAEVREFWTSIPQDSPVWKDYEDQDDILYFAKKVRQQYYDRTGKVASPKQIGEYLHYRALEKRNGASAESAGQKPIAGKPKAKVPRALGSEQASERRGGAAPKHIHDMTPEEERAYLMDVAAGAVSSSGD